jgi:proteasome lid subunit RPN8/RPN11
MRLVAELQRRGKGRQESGAFLLGNTGANDRRVSAFICYDELDASALSSGIVAFHGQGFSALWALCEKRGLRVLADAHTHPSADVRQSSIDKNNPMLPVQGHIALILPCYGRTSKWSLAGVGIHVFQGQRHWMSFRHDHKAAPVSLCMW